MNATGLKLKGRRLYRGDIVVATISGYREHSSKFGVIANFCVLCDNERVAEGFCYFRDAVKWAKNSINGRPETR